MNVPDRRQLRRAIILAGTSMLAIYWLALACGMHGRVVTRWVFLLELAVPTALVIARAVCVRPERAGWSAFAAGLVIWTAGFVPSGELADELWIASYAFPLIGLAFLARPWLRRASAPLLLETLLVLFATAAVVTAPVIASASQLANVAYPLADGVLLSVAVIGAAVAGRSAGSPWALIAVGAAALTVGDAVYAADGGSLTNADVLYPLWPALVAAAAYLPGRSARRLAGVGVRTHLASLVAAAAAIALLTLNEWLNVPAPSVILAALALTVAAHRSWLSLTVTLRATLAAGRERELVEEVREALEREELDLHFQPLVEADSGVVKGAEALLRWYRDGKFVPPDTFLGAVERSELMRPLTDYVLDRALAAAARWHADGHPIGISVNLATANLREPDLPGRVLAALHRHGLPPAALTLEITETAAIEDSALAEHVLRALDELGVGLAVDDFGTGHSSLVRLAHFPICELKIDRSFVMEMHTATRPIVATSIQLAHALGLRVVAEGVEDADALETLCELGCDLAQGYFISRPVPEDAFAAWLRGRAYSRV